MASYRHELLAILYAVAAAILTEAVYHVYGVRLNLMLMLPVLTGVIAVMQNTGSGVLFLLLLSGYAVVAVLADPYKGLLDPNKILLSVIGTGILLAAIAWRRSSQRRQTEPDLGLYRDLLRHYPEGTIAYFDRDLRFLVAEGTELAAVGLERTQVIGKSIYDLFDAEVLDLIENDYKGAIRGESHVREIPYRGEIYRTHSLPVRSESGEIIGGLYLIHRITDLKRIQEKASEIQTLFDTFMRHVPGAVFIKDRDLRYQYVNAAWEALFHKKADEVKGLSDHDLWSEDIANQFIEHDLRVMADRSGFTTLEIATVDGRPRYFNVTKFPIFDSDGLVGHVAGIAIELSEPLNRI